MGHRIHHLYLWHIADEMGVLSNVLNILSSEVGADGNNVPTDTAKTQKKRLREEEIQERKENKAFRIAVGTSLTSLAKTNTVIAKCHKIKSCK